MKKIYYIVLGVLFVLGVASLLLVDDDIRPEAQAMYDQTIQEVSSNAYVYFWGIQAALSEDPLQAGQKIFNSIKRAEKNYFNDSFVKRQFSFVGYPKEKRIHFTSYSSKKDNNKSEDKVDWLFGVESFSANKLSKEDIVLLSRYKKLMRMNDFHTLTKPHIVEPIQKFHLINNSNDLVMLTAIDKAKNEGVAVAVNLLLQNISILRNYLKQADTLIGRLVATVNISNNLDVLSVLINKYHYSFDQTISPLTLEERSLEKAFNREFAMVFTGFKNLDKQPTLLSKTDPLPSVFVQMIYKPNMTINASYPYFSQFVENSKLSLTEFTEEAGKEISNTQKTSYLRNYAGKILLDVGLPDFNIYIGRVFALDVKIQSFNMVVKKRDNLNHANEVDNPFYKGAKKYYLSEDKTKVCFDVPTKIRERDQCLRVKL